MDGKRIKEAAGDFPATVFPEEIVDIAMDSYTDACFPMSYSLSSMLLAICVAIGTSRTLKWRQRVFQCNLFMAIVGKAGAVKSHPVDSALSPLRERDSITLREYAASLRDYREGRTHEKPVPHQYVTNDVTTEGLAKILLNNPGGVCVHNDELNGLFKSFDRYHQGGGDVEKWLSFFDGKALTVNRKSTDDIINIVQPFVSFIGTIQPAVLIKTFTSELIENGMFPRILYVSNSSADKPVLWNSEEDLPSTREDDWRNFISRVIDLTGQTMEYTMNQKAIETICTWRNIIENGLFDDGDEERLLIFRKIQVYALRFCIPMKVMWEIAENREATTEVTSKEKEVVNTVMPEIGYDISRLMLDIQCSIWEFIHGLDVHSAIPIVLFPDDNPVYLNFNYTATLETVYAIDPSKVFHIHGDVRNVENDLVFGHGKNYDELVSKFSMESNDISSDLYDDPGEMKDLISDASRQLASARKCTEDIIRKNHNLFANLSSVQTVCSMGFSFSDVDLPYIDLIAEKVSPNALWKFGWHTDSDIHTMKALVRDRGLRRVEYFYF